MMVSGGDRLYSGDGDIGSAILDVVQLSWFKAVVETVNKRMLKAGNS